MVNEVKAMRATISDERACVCIVRVARRVAGEQRTRSSLLARLLSRLGDVQAFMLYMCTKRSWRVSPR